MNGLGYIWNITAKKSRENYIYFMELKIVKKKKKYYTFIFFIISYV